MKDEQIAFALELFYNQHMSWMQVARRLRLDERYLRNQVAHARKFGMKKYRHDNLQQLARRQRERIERQERWKKSAPATSCMMALSNSPMVSDADIACGG